MAALPKKSFADPDGAEQIDRLDALAVSSRARRSSGARSKLPRPGRAPRSPSKAKGGEVMKRVTGSLIEVERKSGPVYYMKARDRDGRQIKRKLGPVADWPRKQAQDALRDFLTDLGRVPDGRRLGHLQLRRERLAALRRARSRPRTVDCPRLQEHHRLHLRHGSATGRCRRSPSTMSRSSAAICSTTLSPRTTQKTLDPAARHLPLRRAPRLGEGQSVADAERVTVKPDPSSRCSHPSRCRPSRRATGTEQDAALILVAAFTGLRLGELRGAALARRRLHEQARARSPLVLRRRRGAAEVRATLARCR